MPTATESPVRFAVSDDAIQMAVVRTPEGYVDSVVNLEWCITKSLRDEIEQKQVVDPQLLLLVVHEEQEVDRFLVPLAAFKTQIHFRFPGTNTVYAVAIWPENGLKNLRKEVMSRDDYGNFKVTAIKWHDKELERLEREFAELESEQWGVEGELENERGKIPSDPPVLPDDATDEQRQVFDLERQIDKLGLEIDKILGRHSEPDMELIARLETELAAFTPRIEAARASRNERRKASDLQPRIVDRLRRDSHSSGSIERSDNFGALDVEIPSKMFAKEAWRLTKWLGNIHTWPTSPRDQCHLRKRAVWTAILYWPIAIFKAIAWVIVFCLYLVAISGLLIAGMRDINFGALRQPLRTDPRDLLLSSGHHTSVWFKKRLPSGKFVNRSPVFFILNPLFFVLFVGAGFAAWLATDDVVLLGAGVSVLLILALSVLVVSYLFRGPLDRFIDKAGEVLDNRRTRKKTEAIAVTRREMRELSCDVTEQRPTSGLAALPRRRRVSYVAHNVKAKVCRPYPGVKH